MPRTNMSTHWHSLQSSKAKMVGSFLKILPFLVFFLFASVFNCGAEDTGVTDCGQHARCDSTNRRCRQFDNKLKTQYAKRTQCL